jgi:hypothetical protein
MKLICPAFGINEPYSSKLLIGILEGIANKEDPFVILEKDEMNYMQSCFYQDGFILEYQECSIKNHYISTEILTGEIVYESFNKYFNNDDSWKSNIKFKEKKIKQMFLFNLGLLIGSIIAKPLKMILDFNKGFIEGYNKAGEKKEMKK